MFSNLLIRNCFKHTEKTMNVYYINICYVVIMGILILKHLSSWVLVNTELHADLSISLELLLHGVIEKSLQKFQGQNTAKGIHEHRCV